MSLIRIAPAGAVVLLFVFSFRSVLAAPALTSPGGIIKSQQDTQEYYELLKKERKEQIKPDDEPVIEKPPEPVAAEPAADGRRIVVKRFEVSSSEVLTRQEIASVTDAYLNRELGINQLMGVVNEINQLYIAKAETIARAVLPRQKVTGGVIKIQLIEARIGNLQLKGTQHTSQSYVQRQLSLSPGGLIQLQELKQNLLSFNRWNDIALKGSLQPGEEDGTTDIVIIAKEAQQYSLNVFADNSGSESVGESRLGFSAQVASLFGYRDRFLLGSSFSEGSVNAWTSYDIPVHRSGTRVGLSYDFGDIEIIDGPLVPLNVTGDSSNAGISLTQPVAARNSYDWDTHLGFIRKSSDSYFDGVKLVNTTADDINLGTNLRFYDQGGTWLTSHVATFGKSDSVEGRNYFIYSGSLIRLQYFQNNSSLMFRSRWQFSHTNDLPSFNQMIVGGMASVRGYSEGLLSGDEGFTLSAEYSYPLDYTWGWAQRSNIFTFVDSGAAFPFRGDNGADSKSEDFLLSAGIGLDFDVFESISFKLSIGVPMKNKTFYEQDSYRVNAVLNWNAW